MLACVEGEKATGEREMMSIFGEYVGTNGTMIRAFYHGERQREEAWLEETVEGREGANWKAWFVSDINSGGKCTRHHSLEAATVDYDARVDALASANQQAAQAGE